jgi:hypothetical protein
VLKQYLDLATVFIDVNQETDEHPTPVQVLSLEAADKDFAECMRLLLRNGASLLQRNRHGQTCLHTLLGRRQSTIPTVRGCLLFLVQNGADVRAVDNYGRSVSSIAYRNDQKYGCLTGDLWDSVLSECGYDIRQFRKTHARKPLYTQDYTRTEFEEFWKGREDSCPYYDDPSEWPPLEHSEDTASHQISTSASHD